MADAQSCSDTGGKPGKRAGSEGFLVLPVIVLILAQMGTSGDNGAVTLSTASLTQQLGASMTDIQLVNMVYSLIAGALMIGGGLMGTVIGWKKNFRIGAVLCAIGELSMALAPSITVFIWVGRVITGLGASFMIPSVLGLIPRIYQGKARAVAFGCVGAATGLAMLFPIVMGLIIDAAGFRVTFAVLACYFVVVFALSFLLPSITQDAQKPRFDVVGTVLASLGLFLVLMGMSRISAWGLIAPYPGVPFTLFGISPCVPLMLAGIVVLVIMVKLERGIERRNGIALLPQSFLKSPQVLAGLAAAAVVFFYIMCNGAVLLNPYLQLVCGWSATVVGSVHLLFGLPMFLFSMGIPRFFPAANPKRVLQAGYVTAIVALVPLYFGFEAAGANVPFVLIGEAIAGAAAGMLSSHASNVVALSLDERDAAQSGGIQATTRNIGSALGVALLGTILLFSITSGINASVAHDAAVSPAVAQQVSQRNITLMSDDAFQKSIADIQMTDAEQQALANANVQARVDAAHLTVFAVAIVVLLGLLTTPLVKVLKKEDRRATRPAVDAQPDGVVGRA